MSKVAFMENALALQNEKHCLTMVREHKEVDGVVDEFEQVLKDQVSIFSSTCTSCRTK